MKVIKYVAVATVLAGAPCYSASLYQFSYEFESGAQLTGTFRGEETSVRIQEPSPFDDTVTVFAENFFATFTDFSGTTQTWDSRILGHSSSQASLIDFGEVAFVSLDGAKMDLALSAGFENPVQIFLENGIQSDGGTPSALNNASTNNLLPTDFAEPFQPSSWSLSVVPEPSASGLILVSFFITTLAGPKKEVA